MLALTDDEVVAIALAAGSFWPSFLPTVDIDDSDELARASLRGRRSLLVRQLPEGEGEPAADVRLVLNLPGRLDGVSVVVADAELNRRAEAHTSVHYPNGAAWMLESISPLGVHEFDVLSRDVHHEYIAEMATALFGAVGDDELRGDRLLVTGGAGVGAPVAIVGPGSAVLGQVSDDGSVVASDEEVGLAEALAEVMPE